MLNKIKCLSVWMPTGMSAVMSIMTLLFLTGCVGLESANAPKETFVLPRAYQEVYQLALVQAKECWSDDGGLPVKGQLDPTALTAQVFVTNGLGSGRYGQVDIRALDDKNSEITVRLAGVNIWDAAALAAMHEALQFGVWTCTRYMPSARPANKK